MSLFLWLFALIIIVLKDKDDTYIRTYYRFVPLTGSRGVYVVHDLNIISILMLQGRSFWFLNLFFIDFYFFPAGLA